MNEEISKFLDNKGIEDDFIRNIVIRFVNKHTELYGDVVPFESLMERLNTNLNSINLIDPAEKAVDLIYKNVVGCYEGFDKNCISMFFTQEHLKDSQLREDFTSILIHELTHCAYNIKENDIYKSESQIFGNYDQLLDGKTPLVKGNDTYMEPIVNYISSRIYGSKNVLYLSQTVNIEKLVSILDEKEIIRSAFNSDEESFKSCFSVLPEGAYEYYTKGMEYLNSASNFGFGYNRGVEIMENFFNGNIPSLMHRRQKIEELKKIKSSILQVKSLSHDLGQNYQDSLKKRGYIDLFLLMMFLGIITMIIILL